MTCQVLSMRNLIKEGAGHGRRDFWEPYGWMDDMCESSDYEAIVSLVR